MRVKSRPVTGRRWSGTVWAWRRVQDQIEDVGPAAESLINKIWSATNEHRPIDEVSLSLTPGEEDILESIMDSDEELNGELARDD